MQKKNTSYRFGSMYLVNFSAICQSDSLGSNLQQTYPSAALSCSVHLVCVIRPRFFSAKADASNASSEP